MAKSQKKRKPAPETAKNGENIETLSLADLRQDTQNARKHNSRNIGMIETSLRQVGAARSGVIDENGVILAGNGTYEALAAAGIQKVKVIEADGNEWVVVKRTGLTEEQKRILALADNRSGELAEWDPAILAIQGISLDPWFTEAELRKIGAGSNTLGEDGPDPQLDKAEALREQYGVSVGQIWQLGEQHRLMCGDCRNKAAIHTLTAGESIDALVTDPPYCSGGFQEAGKKSGSIGTRGTEMIANDTLSTRGYTALIKTVLGLVNVGVIYIFTDWRMWVNLFDVAESSGYGVRNMIVWDKGTPGMGRGWRSQHELILCGMRVTQPFDPHKAQGNVIQCTRTGNVNHATEKPVELVKKILDVSDIAKSVYDPFLGSGTTLIACEQLNRRCYAMEISPQYVAVSIQRWVDLTSKEPKLL